MKKEWRKDDNTHIEGDGPDVVFLVKRLQAKEAHCDNVVRIVQESQMHHRELLAIVAYAHQMPRAIVCLAGAEHSQWLVLLTDAVDGDADLETLVVALICEERESGTLVKGYLCHGFHSPSLLSVTSLAISHNCWE